MHVEDVMGVIILLLLCYLVYLCLQSHEMFNTWDSSGHSAFYCTQLWKRKFPNIDYTFMSNILKQMFSLLKNFNLAVKSKA